MAAFINKPLRKEHVVVAIASTLHQGVVLQQRGAVLAQALAAMHRETRAPRTGPKHAAGSPDAVWVCRVPPAQ